MAHSAENEELLNEFVKRINQNTPKTLLSRRDTVILRAVAGFVSFVCLFLMSSLIGLFSRVSVLESAESDNLRMYLTRAEYIDDRDVFLPVKSYVKIETERSIDVVNMFLDLAILLKIREEDIRPLKAKSLRDLNKSILLGTYSTPSLK